MRGKVAVIDRGKKMHDHSEEFYFGLFKVRFRYDIRFKLLSLLSESHNFCHMKHPTSMLVLDKLPNIKSSYQPKKNDLQSSGPREIRTLNLVHTMRGIILRQNKVRA